MIWLVILTGGFYFFVIASFFYGWEKLAISSIKEEKRETFISVVIPMRNEEGNIANLLHDLNMQTYPADYYEIIIVDDHSNDHSIEKVIECNCRNYKILSLPPHIAGKKAALQYGIENAKGDLIITTDADCRTGKSWLTSIASYYQQTKPVMIIAPVLAYEFLPSTLQSNKFSFFKRILGLELMSLAGSTAGAASIGTPIMCNGANLAFTKSIYAEIEHVYQNDHIASGDDVFAMLELKRKYPDRVKFIKSTDAVVYSHFPTSVFSFFQQRSRWAAKSKFYRDPFTIVTALVVFGVNFLLMTSFLCGFLYNNFAPFFILLLIKSLIDFPFLYRVAAFFGQKKLMVWFPLVQSFYFLYVCTTVFVATVLPISWKERRI
jgi:cellulose synthase/poly-beta-1,6-N-acetylglucosamine synthase-like glycosyltransferase